MTAEKMKRLEMRRISREIEVRRAKRREAISELLKIIGYMIVAIALTSFAYVFVSARNAEVERECKIMELRHELRQQIREADKVQSGSAGYGLAQFTKMFCTALLRAEVK